MQKQQFSVLVVESGEKSIAYVKKHIETKADGKDAFSYHAACSDCGRPGPKADSRLAAYTIWDQQELNALGMSKEQFSALIVFADANGRTWKAKLRKLWDRADAPTLLHALRNTHGPKWLTKFKLQ